MSELLMRHESWCLPSKVRKYKGVWNKHIAYCEAIGRDSWYARRLRAKVMADEKRKEIKQRLRDEITNQGDC